MWEGLSGYGREWEGMVGSGRVLEGMVWCERLVSAEKNEESDVDVRGSL